MSASGRLTPSSRRMSQTGFSTEHTPQRREKTKSSQSYLQHRRHESSSQARLLNPAIDVRTTQPSRPLLKGRAYSAPLVPKSQLVAEEDVSADDEMLVPDAGEEEEEENSIQQEIADDPFFQRLNLTQTEQQEEEARSGESRDGSSDTEGPLSPTSKEMKARPDSTAEPLGSPLSPRSPISVCGMIQVRSGWDRRSNPPQLPWPENSPRMQEINIAVLGSPKVGKSTFVQRAFDLRGPPTSHFTSRKMSIDGNVYVVRLIELSYDDLDLDNEKRICWPDVLDGTPVPIIDGAFTLYDVMNKDSLVQVPETLSGIYNASIPFILVACKCDHPPSRRLVDPMLVDQRAKALIGDVTAFQTAQAAPDSQKRCVAVLLRAIVSVRNQHLHLAAARRRAHSSAVRHVARQPCSHKHNRANSEFTGSMMHDQARHGHGGLTTNTKPNHNLPALPNVAGSRRGHDFDKTPETDGGEFEHPPSPEKMPQTPLTLERTPTQQLDAGSTFDELVDRLLSQPMSKLDTKFAAIFLALYRKFASPGELLDAILGRFDAVSQDSSAQMTKAQAQLRHLTILDSWIGHYPGDFAYPSTRKKLERFITRITSVRLFSVAVRELTANLENVVEDDDTDWGFSDRMRERKSSIVGSSLATEIVGLAITGDDTPPLSPSTTRSASNSTSTSSSQALLHQVDSAQRMARQMTPNPRLPLTKLQWRALMATPEDVIAKELTRMDWIMFTSIRPRDLIRHVSLPAAIKAKCRSLENVQRMIDHFNHLAFWVSNFVLFRDKPKHRALMLEKFMKIARELRKLNNYNSLGAVLAGVNSSSVLRLQATKDLVPPASSKDFMKLEILMSSQKSHFAYRLAWENTPAERIPYLPLHRRDLVSASEGNKTFIGMDDKDAEELWMSANTASSPLDREAQEQWSQVRINWKKFEIMGEVTVGVQRAQGVPYPLAHFGKNEDVKALVMETEIRKDEDDLYDRSVTVEPAGAGANRRRFQWFQGSGLASAFP